MGRAEMARMSGRTRRSSTASGLAICAALLAAPVAADGGSMIHRDSAGSGAALDQPVTFEHMSLVDRRGSLVQDGHIDWTLLLPEPGAVDLETEHGLTPSGVEWTRVTAVDPSGVEWTRLRASDPDGSSWTRTSTTDPSGVEWTFMIHERADGAMWVESRFLDAGGRLWSRSAPGDDLDGVEWT